MANTLKTPKVMPSEFCANGDKNTILTSPSTSNPQLANFSTGFPAITQTPIPNGGIPPERADFNGMFNLLSSALVYIQNGGQWTFVPEVSNAIGGYPAGAILNYYDAKNKVNKRVISNINNNVNNFLLDPSQIGDSSKPWSYTENTPIVQDLTNPSANTVPSTKAVSNESSRIVSIMDTKVNKSGDTMSGTLKNDGVFVSQFDSINYIARSKTLVKGTTPTDSDKYVGYEWQDKNGQRLAYFGVAYGTNGNKRLELQKLDSNLSEFNIPFQVNFQGKEVHFTNLPYKPSTDFYGAHYKIIGTKAAINFRGLSTTTGHIIAEMLLTDKSQTKETYHSIKIDRDIDNQITTTHCPVPENNSNSDAIATTNWAGGLKRGNTWLGKNKFSVSPEIHINGNARYKSVCTGYTKGTAPTTSQFGGISTTDKNGVEVATLYSSIDTNNSVTSALWVKQPTTAGTTSEAISISCDKNGVFHTSCSVQSAEPNSIVTTALHGTNYMRFSNGLQICWGNSAVGQTITLPQPFKDANYQIAFCQTDGGEHNINQVVTNKTTTSFMFSIGYTGDWIAIGYWY